MSPTFRQHKTLSVAFLLFVVLAMTVSMAGVAFGEGAPYKEVPGFPKYGCYDVVTAGQGMWAGNTPYPLSLDVPGPVLDAYLVWIGSEDIGAPDSPNQSDLVVNGNTVVGSKIDEYDFSESGWLWHMWRANVGPSGSNLVQQGLNKWTISGWNLKPDGTTQRNGVSLVVVYSTGMCQAPNQVDLIDNMDYSWELKHGTTDVLAFTFAPMPEDRDITVWLHYAGAHHVTDRPAEVASPDLVPPNDCRGMNLWARTGSGGVPPALVNYATNPPSPVNGGKLVVVDPFVGAGCGTTSSTYPVMSMWGWLDEHGWTKEVGGYIAPEWSLVRIKVRVKAGDTYLALQLESEKTNSQNPEGTGESGAWFAQAALPVAPEPKLKIAKTDGVATANPGDTLTYTLDYENYGNVPTLDTKIVDTLPEYVTFDSASNGGVYDAATRTVTWNLGAVNHYVTGQVSVKVKLDPIFPAGMTTLTNKATISTTTAGEVDLSDNTATDTTTVTAKAELAIEKTGAPEPVEQGENLTYTIKWTVGGNAFSEDTKVVDTLPENVAFVSASNGGVHNEAAGTVTWDLGNQTPPANGTLTLVVKADKPQKNGTLINNSVTITNKANDSATDTAVNTVHADPGHTLDLTKTNNLGGQPADANGTFVWTIGYTVGGTTVAPNVVITDPLPDGVEYVSSTDGGTYNAATHTVTWKLGDLAAGTTGSVSVTVRAKKTLADGTEVSNTATITDDDLVTDQATNVVTVRARPILEVTKKNTPATTVKPGDTISYEVCFTNTGVGSATNVVLTDVIPVNTTYVLGSATGGATYNEASQTLSWKDSALAPDEEICGTFKVTVNLIITGLTGQANVPLSFAEWNALTIDNTAVLTADDLAPKQAKVSNPLDASVKPQIYKSAQDAIVHRYDPVVFTVTVRNDGSASATNVVVTDQIRPRLDDVTATTTKGTVAYDPATRLLTITIGELKPGEVVTITIKGKAAHVPAAELPYKITNDAVISFTEGAPRTSNLVTVQVVYMEPGEIPEPGTWLMLGTGLAGMAGYARMRVQARRRKNRD